MTFPLEKGSEGRERERRRGRDEDCEQLGGRRGCESVFVQPGGLQSGVATGGGVEGGRGGGSCEGRKLPAWKRVERVEAADGNERDG